jgi:tRNA U34 5-methylaminomethyl-2-thiouridine-forming methyltransferase MnmC
LNEIKIIRTGDGSLSLLNVALNETYHSRHGAVQESMHVFIKQGLAPLIEKKPKSIEILEIGFGTGLNALLTAAEAIRHHQRVMYTALETFPLKEEWWQALNYPDPHSLLSKLHSAPWNQSEEIHPVFRLQKVNRSLQMAVLPAATYDLTYFDAFAPGKQPEMWELPMLQKVAAAMKPGGVLVTYCAKGQLKRDLKSLGLIVEALPGPPGKREMIRATKG